MYLDPGFGQMLVQVIIAALAVCGGYFFVIKKKLHSMFSKKGSQASEEVEEAENEAKAKVAALKDAMHKPKDEEE